MIDKKSLLNKLVMLVSIVLFVFITINNLLNHNAWLDESIAWNLSKEMNIHNIIPILRQEGHFIIWYLLIMPFAKLNFHYPVSISVINWLAYFVAILILWKKAPFNNLFKILITFSWLSLNYFSVVARCYSIGILGLFILLSLYDKQIKRPYLYSFMLVYTAHTSLLATLPVVPLACIFCYNLFKNKNEIPAKNIIFPLIILFSGVFLLFLPFFDGYGYKGMVLYKPDYKLIYKFFDLNHYIMLFCYIFSIFGVLIFSDNKTRFFTLFTLIEFLGFFCFIYALLNHLGIFFIVYLILFFWLSPKLYELNYKTFLFLICFTVILYWDHTYHMEYIVNNIYKAELVNFVKSQEEPAFFFLDISVRDIIPYIDNFDYFNLNPKTSMKSNINSTVKYLVKSHNIKEKVFLISQFSINSSSIEVICSDKSYSKAYYITPY